MTVKKAVDQLGLTVLASGDQSARIEGCCVCDLLSHVMANGIRGGAWITVQTHVNTVAVATLLDLACIIVPQNIAVDALTVEKANEEGIAVLQSQDSAFTLAGRLYELGVR
jgi:hypothetical protein